MKTASGDSTGRRLGLLLMGYLGAVVAVIVLAPFRFAPLSTDRVLLAPAGVEALSDLVLNVALFVPLGFLLERFGPGRWRLGLVVVASVVASLLIEVTQLFLPDRWTTLTDVASNSFGAAIGATASATIRRRLGANDSLSGRLFLDLPLLGLCWLLVPMVWAEALAGARWGPLLALAAAGGFAIAGAGRSNAARQRQPGGTLWWIAAGWVLTATLPTLPGSPIVMLGALAVTLISCGIGDVWWRLGSGSDRRVEPRAVAAVLASLGVWFAVRIAGANPLDPSVIISLRERVMEWLAIGAGFTVLGYAVSEWRGRSAQRWPASALIPVLLAMVMALPLAGGSVWLVGLGLVVAAFGSLLFDVQRAHVMARRGAGAESH